VTTLPPRVQELAERVAGAQGVEVLELALRRHGRSLVLSVVLDSDDPVDADVVERVTKDLSHELDEADPLRGSYTLEVTTPGLDRPLHSGRDFRRQRGHEVEVLREVSGDGGASGSETSGPRGTREGSGPRNPSGDDRRRQLRGVVTDVDDQAVTLEVEGSRIRVPLSDVVRGRVVLPW
jgi:ribosome maturation factor RimP